MSKDVADLTVVIPNYNHARYIPYALEGLLRQTLMPKKIIIIDDASTDNSVEVINAIIAKNATVDISLICHTVNQGVMANCNQALNLVVTKYVAFLAADDICHAGLFEESMLLLNKNPNAGFCSTRSYVIDEKNNIMGECYIPLVKDTPSFISPEECLRIFRLDGGWFLGNTRIFNRVYLQEMHGFPENLLSLSDSLTSIIIACQYGACFIPKILASYRHSAQTYSSQSSRNPERIRQMLTGAKDLLLLNYSDIFNKQDIKVIVERWMLTFLLSILRSSVDVGYALTQSLSIIPKGNAILRSVLIILWRVNLLSSPRIMAFILYAVVRPYDLYRRFIRLLYKPFYYQKLKAV